MAELGIPLTGCVDVSCYSCCSSGMSLRLSSLIPSLRNSGGLSTVSRVQSTFSDYIPNIFVKSLFLLLTQQNIFSTSLQITPEKLGLRIMFKTFKLVDSG